MSPVLPNAQGRGYLGCSCVVSRASPLIFAALTDLVCGRRGMGGRASFRGNVSSTVLWHRSVLSWYLPSFWRFKVIAYRSDVRRSKMKGDVSIKASRGSLDRVRHDERHSPRRDAEWMSSHGKHSIKTRGVCTGTLDCCGDGSPDGVEDFSANTPSSHPVATPSGRWAASSDGITERAQPNKHRGVLRSVSILSSKSRTSFEALEASRHCWWDVLGRGSRHDENLARLSSSVKGRAAGREYHSARPQAEVLENGQCQMPKGLPRDNFRPSRYCPVLSSSPPALALQPVRHSTTMPSHRRPTAPQSVYPNLRRLIYSSASLPFNVLVCQAPSTGGGTRASFAAKPPRRWTQLTAVPIPSEASVATVRGTELYLPFIASSPKINAAFVCSTRNRRAQPLDDGHRFAWSPSSVSPPPPRAPVTHGDDRRGRRSTAALSVAPRPRWSSSSLWSGSGLVIQGF